mgnify:CR=1 FL=1
MKRNWNTGEVRAALALYLQLDFGKFHQRNREVILLASALGRTPSAVALKLGDLAALDDSLPRRGMSNASATDRAVWQEFLTTPEKIVTALEETQRKTSPNGFADKAEAWTSLIGRDATTKTTVRRGQQFFRDMILTAYKNQCSLTGTDDPRLLNASHIIGWSEAPELRMNPQNGLCLNALHDRAFDRHLITFDEDFRMTIASDVPWAAQKSLEKVDSQRLTMPSRFLPSQAYLEQHRLIFHSRQA